MKCDLHVHSSLSFDSVQTLDAIGGAAARAGLDAVAVANHNRVLPPDAPLTVDGVRIIPAAEYSTDVGHVLVLFHSVHLEELGLRPDGRGLYGHQEVLRAARGQGAVCVLAHPFASGRNPSPQEIARFDGVEVCNSRAAYARRGQANPMAWAACGPNQVKTAGSDAHFPWEIGRAYAELDCAVDCGPQELLRALKSARLHLRPTSPAASALSQLIKARKLRRPGLIPRNLLKAAYGVMQWLAPWVKPYRLD